MYRTSKNFSKNMYFIILKQWKKTFLSSNFLKSIPLYRKLKNKRISFRPFLILHS